MVPRCWYCPDQALGLYVRVEDQPGEAHPVTVAIWKCPVCGHGTIAREQPEAELPLFPSEGA